LRLLGIAALDGLLHLLGMERWNFVPSDAWLGGILPLRDWYPPLHAPKFGITAQNG